MSGVMLPMTSAEAGSGVRSSGSTAAAWLGVKGTGQSPISPASSPMTRSK